MNKKNNTTNRRNSNRLPRRICALAMTGILTAATILTTGCAASSQTPGGRSAAAAYAVSEAKYPEMAAYPDEMKYEKKNGDWDSDAYEKDYDAWRSSMEERQAEEGYADGLEPFFQKGIRQILTGTEGKNRACSPINLYMALGMLAELTGGESRQQILSLLGAEQIETLRTQAEQMWNAHYRKDGTVTSVLASSVWLREGTDYHQEALDTLAKHYYASSYQGKMGSPEYNRALQSWLNEQTGGLLKEQAGQESFDEATMLALASTVYFQAGWGHEFSKNLTETDVFHGAEKDTECAFMHSSESNTYYWGDRFSAVAKYLKNSGGRMCFFLPDEGVSVDELLEENDVFRLMADMSAWENQKDLMVNLSVPKFDIASRVSLKDSMQAMGITDVFDPDKADFTTAIPDGQGVFLSQAVHSVRTAIDEEGVTAAAYTVMAVSESTMPPAEEIDVVLDRPFLFVVLSEDGIPLFAGVVNQP